MFENQRIGAVLLMAGSGFRMQSEVPKQFLLIGEEEVYRYAMRSLIESSYFEEIVLVCHPDWLDIDVPQGVKVVAGGKTRQESSYIGLRAFAKKPDIVLIHDAVRPFVSKEILRENILAAIAVGAVDTCIPSADTIVRSMDGKRIDQIPDRSNYFRGQTPQCFQYALILQAHQNALEKKLTNQSDDCSLVHLLGAPIAMVAGDEQNMKITSELDLKIANFFVSPVSLENR